MVTFSRFTCLRPLRSFVSDYLCGVDHPISIISPFKLFSNFTAHTIFHARIATPEGMDVMLYMSWVLPDVLIFDGLPTTFTPTSITRSIREVSNTENPEDDVPLVTPLPIPLPPDAFAHVRHNTLLATDAAARLKQEREYDTPSQHVSPRSRSKCCPGTRATFAASLSLVVGRTELQVCGVSLVSACGLRDYRLARAMVMMIMLPRHFPICS